MIITRDHEEEKSRMLTQWGAGRRSKKDEGTPNGYTHVGKVSLLKRGWTGALIRDHLPDPEAFAINEHYKSGPLRQLWTWPTVLKAETVLATTIAAVLQKRCSRRARK